MPLDAPLVPLLFVDLDDTVRKGKTHLGRYVNGPDDVEVFPEALERMAAWRAGGGRIVGVSNQGGIALGHVPADQVEAAMTATMRACDGLINLVVWCPHHPDATDPRMARCWCRKPRAGLLSGAAVTLSGVYGETYPAAMALMVGDRDEDQGAALAADVDFAWADAWRAGEA